MSLIQAVLLGFLQGATEFLPVSSSAHLVLFPWLLGWPDPGVAFDVALHCATAVAVVGYFWRDWMALLHGAWQALRTRSLADPQARLALFIVLGCLPAAVAGVLLEDFFTAMFGRPAAVSAFLLVTAAILALSEHLSRRQRGLEHLTWQDALVIGGAQAVAILPGISRSGATIAAGMACGLERPAAARFSFLLATPAILGAGLLQVAHAVGGSEPVTGVMVLLVGFAIALLTGLAAIHFLLRYLQYRPLYPFAIYCAVIGLAGLTLALLRS